MSNPNNQLNFDTSAGLLKYCIKHEHWSIFEQLYMTLEINTTRATCRQIFAHRSFTYQEFSQRYVRLHLLIQSRCQSSVVKTPRTVRIVLMTWIHSRFKTLQMQTQTLFDSATALYEQMLNRGVAKECVRNILLPNTPTRIYMTSTCKVMDPLYQSAFWSRYSEGTYANCRGMS